MDEEIHLLLVYQAIELLFEFLVRHVYPYMNNSHDKEGHTHSDYEIVAFTG